MMWDGELGQHHEPWWRVLVLWHLWPLRWRGPLWFWVEEHTR
jgi:hypothetical protein